MAAISGVASFLWIMGLVYAANNTIQSHALLFNNLGGTFIVAWAIIVGKKVPKWEIIGTAVAILGAFLTLFDGKAQTADGKRPSLVVDLINMCSSCAGAIYFVLMPQLKKIGPLFCGFTVN